MRSVGWPRPAKAAARLMAVVVLPEPPFWKTMPRTLVLMLVLPPLLRRFPEISSGIL